MSFVLLIGFLSPSACAVFVTLASSWRANATQQTLGLVQLRTSESKRASI